MSPTGPHPPSPRLAKSPMWFPSIGRFVSRSVGAVCSVVGAGELAGGSKGNGNVSGVDCGKVSLGGVAVDPDAPLHGPRVQASCPLELSGDEAELRIAELWGGDLEAPNGHSVRCRRSGKCAMWVALGPNLRREAI